MSNALKLSEYWLITDYSECGYNGGPTNAVQSKGRISGGDNAPLYQWPWQVAIYKEEFGQVHSNLEPRNWTSYNNKKGPARVV